MKQLKLINEKHVKHYGGSLAKGQRKITRPLSSKEPMHLVLKAKKVINLRANNSYITGKAHQLAAKFGIKIFGMSVQNDHVHLQILIFDRELYKKFIRGLTGVLARKFGKGLWQVLPFTRVGSWGRDFMSVRKYIEQNELEVMGLVAYKPRHHNYNGKNRGTVVGMSATNNFKNYAKNP